MRRSSPIVLFVLGAALACCRKGPPVAEQDAGHSVSPARRAPPRVAAPGESPADIGSSRITLSVIKDRDTASPVVSTLALSDGAIALDAVPPSARLSVDLDSFNSSIPLRNERVRGIFFETSALGWETAELTATIPPEIVDALRKNRLAPRATLEGKLKVHGRTTPVTLVVDAGYAENGRLWVKTNTPAQVKISDLGLTDNLHRLSAICMHDSIDDVVNVTVSLEFGAE